MRSSCLDQLLDYSSSRCLGGIEPHHRVEASARPSKQAAAPPTLSLALARSLGGPPHIQQPHAELLRLRKHAPVLLLPG